MSTWFVGTGSARIDDLLFALYPERNAPGVVYYRGRPCPELSATCPVGAVGWRVCGVAEVVAPLSAVGLTAVRVRVCGVASVSNRASSIWCAQGVCGAPVVVHGGLVGTRVQHGVAVDALGLARWNLQGC